MEQTEPATTEDVHDKRKIKGPPQLFRQTQPLIEQIEEKLGATFLAYWTSFNGSVCQSDVVGLYEILQAIGPKNEIVLFIKSDGGSGLASLRIVHLLRHYAPKLKALVPLDCASAATMVALGADEIHMGPLAYLTAVDTSLTHDLSPIDNFNRQVSVSQDELTRVVNLWRTQADQNGGDSEANPYEALFPHVHPLVIGAVDRASSLSIKVCTEILAYHMQDREEASRISHHLNNDYPSHGYPITLQEARNIGLNVQPLDADLNHQLLELNKLYSEMGQKAYTHYDEHHYHNNAILNILEGRGIQVYFQNDADWVYRTEERRWVRLDDESTWRKIERREGKISKSIFHIS